MIDKIGEALLLGFLVFALFCAAGCTTIQWRHSSATQEQFLHDRYECRRDMEVIRPDRDLIGGALDHRNRINLYVQCMESKGYSK